MRQTSETTYRVVGVGFDGSREVTSKHESREIAEEKRLMMLFKHTFPSVVIEPENPSAKPDPGQRLG